MKKQDALIAAGLVALLGLVGVWLSTQIDRTTFLIGVTGVTLMAVLGGYVAAVEKYAPRSLRVAVGLAVGWMLLPPVLFGAVVLVWGSPGTPTMSDTPATHTTTTIVYRNGAEVGRYTGDNSSVGYGKVLGVMLLVYGTAWLGYAANMVYRGYRGSTPAPAS